MTKKIITIDCDNILCDTARSFLKYYKETYGDTVTFEEIDRPYLQNCSHFPKFPKDNGYEAYMKFFHRSNLPENMSPLAGAQVGVQSLLEQGYELHMLTGRTDFQKEETVARLDIWFPNCFAQMHFTNDKTENYRPKGEFCKELGAIVHIDDFYHYAETIAQEGIPVALFDMPWNQVEQDSSLIMRISGWEQVDKVISEL